MITGENFLFFVVCVICDLSPLFQASTTVDKTMESNFWRAKHFTVLLALTTIPNKQECWLSDDSSSRSALFQKNQLLKKVLLEILSNFQSY